MLVEAIVGQMDMLLIVCLDMNGVFLRGETRHPLVVQICHQRIEWRHRDVQTNVEFVTVDEVRVGDVFGNQQDGAEWNFFWLKDVILLSN